MAKTNRKNLKTRWQGLVQTFHTSPKSQNIHEPNPPKAYLKLNQPHQELAPHFIAQATRSAQRLLGVKPYSNKDGSASGKATYVLKWAKGTQLVDLAEAPYEKKAKAVRASAVALAEHLRIGISQGDVRAHNLVSTRRRVKLLDYGDAELLHGRSHFSTFKKDYADFVSSVIPTIASDPKEALRLKKLFEAEYKRQVASL